MMRYQNVFKMTFIALIGLSFSYVGVGDDHGAKKPQTVKKSQPQGAKKSQPQGAKKSKPQGAKKSQPQGAKKSQPQGAKKSQPQGTKKSQPQTVKKSKLRGTAACQIDIAGNDQMQYDKKKLEVASTCTSVTLKLKHTGKLGKKVMGHNWVLIDKADFGKVSTAAMKAVKNDYLPPKEDPASKLILAHTDLIGGGAETSVTFDLKALTRGKEYMYFCSFPGHFGLMQGTLVWAKTDAVKAKPSASKPSGKASKAKK